MKPMGTITKYYPFIDEESKSTLDSLMAESDNYCDFVQRLSVKVLEDEVPVNLSYLAAVHVWWCRLVDKQNLIQEKYKDVPCLKPWAYGHNSIERDQILFHDAVVEAIDNAIDSSIEDWMETELHLLHAFYHWPYGDIPRLLEPVEKANALIDTNPNLRCFKPLCYAFEATVRAREGNTKECVLLVQSGRELAETYDDSPFIYMNLLTHADFVRSLRIQESLALFEELYDLAQDLGVPYFIGEILHDSGLAFEIAGEYDLAISSHLEKMKAYGMEDIPDPFPTRIYSTLGDGEKALALMNEYFEYAQPVETIMFHLWRAWALAQVNDLEEAVRTLETAYPMIIKAGNERILGEYYHFSGVVELKRGNLLEALDLIEKAWDIAKRIPAGTNQNRALLDLARVEILLSRQSRDSTEIIAPGKWLCKLESYAEELELPGIRMQAALLKSEFYQKHGQFKDAQATLQDALSITESKGVATLRRKINERIRELNQLLRDASVSSKKRKE
jgi:tetratricopeptide (TPR) repeat protein